MDLSQQVLVSKEYNSEKRCYIFLGIMLFTFFLRNAIGLNIPVIIFLIISIFPIITGDNNVILAYAACCVPFSAGFQYKYALMICIVAFLVRSKGKIKINRLALPIIFLAVWELLHAFYGTFSIKEYFRSFSELFLLATIFCMNLEKVNYKLVLRSLAISTVGVCFILLFIQGQNSVSGMFDIFSKLSASYRFGMYNTTADNFGLNYNPNDFALICCLSITGMLFLYVRKESKIIDVILMALSALFGLMTLSRTFIICLLFTIICFILTSTGGMKQKLLSISAVVFATIIIALLIWQFFPTVFENIVSRFKDSDVLNGRDDLYAFYNKHIFSSFLYFFFGVGIQDLSVKIFGIYSNAGNVTHNGFQEVWVVWGIIGIITFIYLLALMIIKSRSKNRDGWEWRQCIPMATLLLFTSAGQFVRSGIALLSLIIAYVCLVSYKRDSIK